MDAVYENRRGRGRRRSEPFHGGRLELVRVVLAIFCLSQAAALAQAPPSPESTETCTREKQQQSGEECLMCGASDGDPAKCLKRLANRGYQRRCRANGAPVWLELWCRPLDARGQATPTSGASH